MRLPSFRSRPLTAAPRPDRNQPVSPPGRSTGRAGLRLFDTFAHAAPFWRELEAAAPISAYQTLAFCEAWAQTLGAASGAQLLIALLAEPDGTPLALLPLMRKRLGPWRGATFLGGRMANYQMGLFRADREWPRERVERLLRDVAAEAGLDGFAFIHQPLVWRGAPNPMAALGGQPSPSRAFASALPESFGVWRDAHVSPASQKKFRKKARKLAEWGAVELRRPTSTPEIETIVAAFIEQKARRMRALGLPNEFNEPATLAFLRQASGLDGARATLSWRALWAGDRVVSIFAGLAHERRLSGLAISFDSDEAIGRCSPGELLLLKLLEETIAAGFTDFDLGLGEARYKDECCEIAETMFDNAFGFTALGRWGAKLFLAGRALKRTIKQSPRLTSLARRVQRIAQFARVGSARQR